jgi:hypothetical protein
MFDFPRDAQDNLSDILIGKKKKYDRKISNLCKIQTRLPIALHDYSEYENIIDELTILEGRTSNSVFAKVYYDDLIVLYCGKYVKFGKIVPAKKKKTKKSQGDDVMDLNLHIYKNKEIF